MIDQSWSGRKRRNPGVDKRPEARAGKTHGRSIQRVRNAIALYAPWYAEEERPRGESNEKDYPTLLEPVSGVSSFHRHVSR